MSDQLPAEAVQRLREAISAQLAVYPTITQATTILSALPHLRPEPSRLVHVHGTEDGPGLSCREIRLADGSLLGSCQLPPAPTPSPEPSEDDRDAALNVAYGEMRHRELPGSAQVFMEATFVADALLAAGFRRPSPATVEAVRNSALTGRLRAQATWVGDPSAVTERIRDVMREAADAIDQLAAFPAPAEGSVVTGGAVTHSSGTAPLPVPAPVVTEEMVERAADAIQARRQSGNVDRRTALADARAALSAALTPEAGN